MPCHDAAAGVAMRMCVLDSIAPAQAVGQLGSITQHYTLARPSTTTARKGSLARRGLMPLSHTGVLGLYITQPALQPTSLRSSAC